MKELIVDIAHLNDCLCNSEHHEICQFMQPSFCSIENVSFEFAWQLRRQPVEKKMWLSKQVKTCVCNMHGCMVVSSTQVLTLTFHACPFLHLYPPLLASGGFDSVDSFFGGPCPCLCALGLGAVALA